MELAALVAEALLAGAESTEVLGGLWDGLIVKKEVYTTGLLCWEICQLCTEIAVLAGSRGRSGMTAASST